MDFPLLCHFTDSLQHKLDLIVLQFPDSKTIKNDIYMWISVECKEKQKLLANEGSMRLLQSAINRFECKYDDNLELLTVEFSALFELFRPHLHYQKCRLLQWNADDELMYDNMLNLLQPLFVSAELRAGKSIEHSLTFHRNCCLYLYTQVNLASTPGKFQETFIQYLSTLLHHCSTNYDLIYLILKLLQKLKSSWSKVKIMVGMDTLASYFDINNLSNLYSGLIDYKRYLVGFEARWLIDNVITNKLARPSSHIVKMDTSKLTVQGQQLISDDNLIDYKATITTVRGSSPLSYYECLLLSSGFMSIGWATKEAEFSQWKQVGADQHSIGFDGFHSCVWHNNHSDFVSHSWKVGDIIGCSVNSDKKVFTFYLNGIEVKSSTVGNFSTLQYYPAVSLTKNQLCCFNFGQTAFKYSQTNTTQTKTHSYLLAPVILEQCYWFKDNSMELIYGDTEQQKYNQLIIDLEKNLSTTSLRYQSHLKKLESQFDELIDNNNKESALRRMCQAILMHMSSSITGKKIDWIRWIFIKNVDDSTCDSGPSFAKFIEFLYPYVKNEHSLDQIMRRNINLVLSIVVQKYGLLCDMLTEEVSEFLFETILDSKGNKLAVLFAVITLNAMDFSNKELILSVAVLILTREKFLEKLKKQSSYLKKSRFLNPYTLDFILYQIAFCARSLREQILTHLLSSNDLSVSSIDDLDLPIKVRATAVLSCQYISSRMQLSPDQLSARSDRGWQTVLAANNMPEDDIFFCEVILLTCGPMRVGFIAEESIVDLELPLGSSDVSAISFDGFQNVIWSGRKRWPLEKGTGKIRRWKSGDVVGCEMDLSSRKVAFYLNGRKVQIPLEDIDDGFWQDEGNYYLAISLGNQQHILCNFGQKLFRYAKSQ